MKYIKTVKLNAHEAITLEHNGYVLRLKDFASMLWDVWQKESDDDHLEDKQEDTI
jgi:hypothetical protein